MIRTLGSLFSLCEAVAVRRLAKAALLFALFLVASTLVSAIIDYGGLSISVALIVFFLMLVDTIKGFETSLLNSNHQQRSYSLWRGVDAVFRPVVAVLLVYMLGSQFQYAVVGNILAGLTIFLIFWRVRVGITNDPIDLGSRFAKRIDKEITRYAMPLVPVAALGWIIGTADRFFVAALTGPGSAGIYIAAYGLASAPFLALGSIFLTLFRPRLFDAVSQRRTTFTHRILFVWCFSLVTAGMGMALLIHVFRAKITSLVLAAEFSSAARSADDNCRCLYSEWNKNSLRNADSCRQEDAPFNVFKFVRCNLFGDFICVVDS